ncbi:MAG: hypothetical protein K2J63_08370 [Muribaculaceae bacterium]|nr:hypothetical protein [Muribaculaceae bacterium]
MKNRILISASLLLAAGFSASAGSYLYLKTPGGIKTEYELKLNADGSLSDVEGEKLPLQIKYTAIEKNGVKHIAYDLTALDDCWFSFENEEAVSDNAHKDCEFYMPGFWYHHNLRSPEGAPSFNVSDSWTVREDRLSSPLTGIYDPSSKIGYTVLRVNSDNADCTEQNQSGDVILHGHTSVGFTGFRNVDNRPTLVFGYPYMESPKRYIRKLTLINPIRAFEKIAKGDTRHLEWQMYTIPADDYSDFVADVWNYTFDTLTPDPVDTGLDNEQAKGYLANYFRTSFVDKYDMKYYTSCGIRTDDCANNGMFEVGFVGRVLLNAYNALEYGRQHGDQAMVDNATSIFNSVLNHGFTPNGFFKETMNLEDGSEADILSIRRQSEGIFAVLNYLDAERRLGNRHTEWENKMALLLDNMMKLQNSDGSFPRKFRTDMSVFDVGGGSTPSATLPLTMAYKYFNNKKYLESARSTANYLERELIDKADYFSSTLDANCEDKEASLYASTAMYYLTHVTSGKERAHYMDMCKKSAYFCLSWYYLWDVPFASGQMLGDVDFRSRGWGNVSVENNHIDVFIFEFATVLDKLADYYKENRFSNFSNVIKTSMLQLMPREDNTFDIAKKGYYPEVVQHTTWDYGRNGKGFYNDIFAPGWTVASLWQMLSPDRVDNFFD